MSTQIEIACNRVDEVSAELLLCINIHQIGPEEFDYATEIDARTGQMVSELTAATGEIRAALATLVASAAPIGELPPLPIPYAIKHNDDEDGGTLLFRSAQMQAYARAAIAASAPNKQLVAALTEMVSWFGRYPEFVPVPEASDNVKASINIARTALTAAGETTS